MVKFLVVCLVLISNTLAFHKPFCIFFERSGGFTGISTTVEIDSKTLPPEEAEKLEEMIKDSGFFMEIKEDSIPEARPDQFQYKITIEYEGKRQTRELKESTIPGSFRPLINYLSRKARPEKKN